MEGFVEVICASSQSQAFEILESHDIALILIDYTLEDGNGIEFSRKVKRSSAHRNTPILLLSASLTNDLSYFAMRSGINQSRRKPLSPAELRELISTQLTSPFVEAVQRPYFALGCIAWEYEGVYNQYSPDLNQTVHDDTAEGAHDKMDKLLRKHCRNEKIPDKEIVGIEIVYHRLDERDGKS